MATSHYERRDDGFYIVWGADFSDDDPGEVKVEEEEQLNWLLDMPEETQKFYLDLRSKAND